MKAFLASLTCLVILSCGNTDLGTALEEAGKPLSGDLSEGYQTQASKPASRPKPIGPGIWDVDSEHWITLAVKLDPNLDVKETVLSSTEHGAAHVTRAPEGVMIILGPRAAFEDEGVTLFFKESDGRLAEAKAFAYHFRDFGPPFHFPIKLTTGTLYIDSMNLKPGSEVKARFALSGENEFTGAFVGKIP